MIYLFLIPVMIMWVLWLLMFHVVLALEYSSYSIGLNGTENLPSQVVTTFSALFGVETGRLTVLSATYRFTDCTFRVTVAESSLPPTLDVVRQRVITSSQLILASRNVLFAVATIQDVSSTNIFTAYLYYVFAGLCGVVVGVVATLFATSLLKKQSAKRKEEEGVQLRRTERDQQLAATYLPDPQDTVALWEHIKELDHRTKVLLDVNGLENLNSSTTKTRGSLVGKVEPAERESYSLLAPLVSAAPRNDIVLLGSHRVPGLSTGDTSMTEPHWSLCLPPISSRIASLVRRERSVIDGFGMFAIAFINSETLLFPYLLPSFGNCSRYYKSSHQMAMEFGGAWQRATNFTAVHPFLDWVCCGEDPRARGWGCLLNSSQNFSPLEANCKLVWQDDASGLHIPWVKTTETIPPFAELLLDYPVRHPTPK